jgi:hypothetical protein
MSVILLKADIHQRGFHVRLLPQADTSLVLGHRRNRIGKAPASQATRM